MNVSKFVGGFSKLDEWAPLVIFDPNPCVDKDAITTIPKKQICCQTKNKTLEMWAKLFIVILVTLVFVYTLMPNIKRQLDRCWGRMRQWINESEHHTKLKGFQEMDYKLPEVHSVHESYRKSRLQKKYERAPPHGNETCNGRDDLDTDCVWINGGLFCPSF